MSMAVHEVIKALDQGAKYQQLKYLIHRADNECRTAQELIDYLFKCDLWDYDNELALKLEKYTTKEAA